MGLGEEGISAEEFGKGLNFAVGGATALNLSYFEERGVHNVPSHAVSLEIQLDWFKKTYSSVCASSGSFFFFFHLKLLSGNHISLSFRGIFLPLL